MAFITAKSIDFRKKTPIIERKNLKVIWRVVGTVCTELENEDELDSDDMS